MTRLIDADDLIREACVKFYTTPYYKHILDLIDNASTVEERPQGEWIAVHKINSFGRDFICFECNKCKKYKLPIIHVCITEKLDVCPNCGVKMNMKGENDAGARVVK